MIVVVSAPAKTDLHEIAIRIGVDNPDRAASFVRELRGKCRELGRMQLMFPIVPGRTDGMRRRVDGRYSIFYLTAPDRIVVARILHNARDIGPLLGDA